MKNFLIPFEYQKIRDFMKPIICQLIFQDEFTQKRAVRILDFIHYKIGQLNGTLKQFKHFKASHL